MFAVVSGGAIISRFVLVNNGGAKRANRSRGSTRGLASRLCFYTSSDNPYFLLPLASCIFDMPSMARVLRTAK